MKHTAAFGQVFGAVVNPVYLLRGSVGKLALNPVPVVAEFIKKGGGHSAKTMRAHFILFKTHAAYGPAESGFPKGMVSER